MAVEVHTKPFRFPNFVRIEEWPEDRHMLDVGFFTEEQARAYWNELLPLWLAHCATRRKLNYDNRNSPPTSKGDAGA
jgi:hypothetical protein